MILDNDKNIKVQNKSTVELFESFAKQRQLRCNMVHKSWLFEFNTYDKINDMYEYRYIWIRNKHNLSEEFEELIERINSDEYKGLTIVPYGHRK